MHDLISQYEYFCNYPYKQDIYSHLTHPHYLYKARYLLEDTIEFINRHFYYHSDLLFVRVDLSYKQEYINYLSLADVQRHREQLLSDRRNHPQLFYGFIAYMWVLEYGESSTGYHYHLMLIYDGKVRSSGMAISKQVDDLWNYRITQGMGKCFLSNRDEAKFTALGRRGIGHIHRTDFQLRVNLIERVVAYLLKKSCMFEERSGITDSGEFHTFGKTRMPPPIYPHIVRRGRPPVLPLRF